MIKQLTRLAVLVLTVNVALARQPKVSKELKNLDPDSTVDVIIQFNHLLSVTTRRCWIEGER